MGTATTEKKIQAEISRLQFEIEVAEMEQEIKAAHGLDGDVQKLQAAIEVYEYCIQEYKKILSC